MHHRTVFHFHLKHKPKKLEESTRKEILTQTVWKLFLKFAVPAIIGMFMYAIYMFADAVFVGQWVGKEALAAIAIVYPLTLVNFGIAAFMGMGSASLLSRAIGSEDRETISKILGTNIVFVFIFSAVYMVVGYIFAERLVYFMGGRNEILELGTRYFRIVILGSFFMNFVSSSNMLIRAEGRIKPAMILISTGSFLNIALDPIFIKVLGMGIQGAGYATVISMFVTAVMTMVYFYGEDSELSYRKNGFQFAPSSMRQIAPVGFAGLMMQLMTMIMQIMIFRSVRQYGGGDDLTLIGATLNMLSFALIPLWGIAQGLQPVAGINWGAGQLKRVREAFLKFLLAATIIAGVIWGLFMLLPEPILRLYITDPRIVTSGKNAFRTVMAVFLLQGFIFLPPVLFEAIGKGKTASLLLLTREIFLFVPLIILLPMVAGGLNGVWLAIPTADALVVILAVIIIKRELNTMKGEKHESVTIK